MKLKINSLKCTEFYEESSGTQFYKTFDLNCFKHKNPNHTYLFNEREQFLFILRRFWFGRKTKPNKNGEKTILQSMVGINDQNVVYVI